MNKRKAMAWVKALRSGKYKQGDSALMQKNEKGGKTYCCLGVIAKISKLSDSEILNYGDLRTFEGFCGLGSPDGMPAKIEKIKEHDCWGNLVDGINRIPIDIGIKGRTFNNLADANDAGMSFKAIAKWIEKNYELL